MGLPTPGPSLRTGDVCRLLWSLCSWGKTSAHLCFWGVVFRRDPASSQAQHVSGVDDSSITEQQLCCSKENPDRAQSPVSQREGYEQSCLPPWQLYSMGRCSAHSHLAACMCWWQRMGASTLPLLSAAPSLWRSHTLPHTGAETVSWWCCAVRMALSGRSTATAMRRATWTNCSMAWMRVSVPGRQEPGTMQLPTGQGCGWLRWWDGAERGAVGAAWRRWLVRAVGLVCEH